MLVFGKPSIGLPSASTCGWRTESAPRPEAPPSCPRYLRHRRVVHGRDRTCELMRPARVKFTAGMYGIENVGRRHETAATQRRVEARRRLRPVDDPVAKRDQQRPLSMDKRIAVGTQLAVRRGAGSTAGGCASEISAAMLRAGERRSAPPGSPDRAYCRIGRVERHQCLPILGIGVGVKDLGTAVVRRQRSSCPAVTPEIVVAYVPRLRRLCPRILLLAMLRSR